VKSGSYKVSFVVELTNCANEEDAVRSVRAMVNEMLEDDEFPEVELELIDGVDLDYTLEEETTLEVNFG
jgi:hypothetical protein